MPTTGSTNEVLFVSKNPEILNYNKTENNNFVKTTSNGLVSAKGVHSYIEINFTSTLCG